MAETLAPINPALSNVPEYTVSDIAGGVKRLVEERFGRVRVRGEISAWKIHTSGHCYFRLKDESAVLDAVCWRGTVGKLPFKPEDGMEVVASGRITTYPGKSSYQIVVDSLEPAGVGALLAQLEKRKAQLAAEGLFAPERKKPLPYLPRVIGVVTSPTGAVIRDILHRIGERFPCHVIVWPVAVQGEGAAEQVAAAIQGFQRITPRPDLLIVARGGGSVEDLWAFNEETVVRATAASAIPLISAVGHETDTTLIDFASDRRAPTPTAAAEVATPVLAELRLGVSQLGYRLDAGALSLTRRKSDSLDGLARGLPKPQALLEHATQRLDDRFERLRAALPALFVQKEHRLRLLAAALQPQVLLKDIHLLSARLTPLSHLLLRHAQALVEKQETKLARMSDLLAMLDYRNALKRGFALVTDASGKPITHAADAAAAREFTLMFQDGEVQVSVHQR